MPVRKDRWQKFIVLFFISHDDAYVNEEFSILIQVCYKLKILRNTIATLEQ